MQPEQSQLRAVIEESVRANLKKTLDSILGPITNLDLRDTQALRDIVERREGGSEKLQAALELFLKNLETSRSEFSTAAIQMNRALRASLHVLETSKDLQQFSIFAGVKAFTASDLKMGDVFQGYMNTSPLIDFWKEIVSFVVDHKIDKVDHASRAFQQRARTSAHPLHGQLLSFTGGAIAKWLDNVSRNLVEIDVKWTAAASNLLKSGVEIGEIIRITKQMREDLSGYLLHGTPAVQTVMAKMQGALKPYNEKIGDEQMRNDLSSAIVDTLESTRPLSPTLQNLKTRPLSSLTRIEGISLEEVILFVNYQLQITERGMALEYRRPDTLVMGSPRSGKAVAATFSNDEELLSTLKAAIVDIVADARAGVQRILDLAESASAVRQSVPPVLASPSWQQKLRDDFNLDSNLLEPTLAEIALGRTAMEVVIPGRSPKQFSTLRLSINELSTMGEMQFTARSGNGVLKEKRPAKLAIQVNELLGDASRREIEFTRLVDAFVLDEQNVGRKSAVVGAIFQTDQNPAQVVTLPSYNSVIENIDIRGLAGKVPLESGSVSGLDIRRCLWTACKIDNQLLNYANSAKPPTTRAEGPIFDGCDFHGVIADHARLDYATFRGECLLELSVPNGSLYMADLTNSRPLVADPTSGRGLDISGCDVRGLTMDSHQQAIALRMRFDAGERKSEPSALMRLPIFILKTMTQQSWTPKSGQDSLITQAKRILTQQWPGICLRFQLGDPNDRNNDGSTIYDAENPMDYMNVLRWADVLRRSTEPTTAKKTKSGGGGGQPRTIIKGAPSRGTAGNLIGDDPFKT